ncbi:Uncharacterised protein [Mycobacteroides abscessus]|nr:Uncharacterised protein [Mycobacteroides abscessus]
MSCPSTHSVALSGLQSGVSYSASTSMSSPSSARCAPAASSAAFGSVGEPWTSRTPGRRPCAGGSCSARSRTAPTSASPMRYPMSSLSNET